MISIEKKQEIFDTVVNHLRKQGKPAMADGTCAYRGEGDTMCAVGCLIKDKHYSDSLEGNLIDDDFVIQAVSKSLGFDISSDYNSSMSLIGLLRALQRLHDSGPIVNSKWDIWQDSGLTEEAEQRLKAIAEDFGLEYKEKGTND
jgi:hypothetical protein